jgi:amino acid transporter
MVTYLPISSPFIRFAGRFVDDAFGVAAGWNFFVFEAALVPFEIVACNVIIHFWSDVVPVGAIIAIVIVGQKYYRRTGLMSRQRDQLDGREVVWRD